MDQQKMDIANTPEETYSSQEAMQALNMGSSRFYRFLEKMELEGAPIRKYPASGRTYVYDRAQVDKIAPRYKNKPVRRGRPSEKKKIPHNTSEEEYKGKYRLDICYPEDTPAVYLMEYVQTGFSQGALGQIINPKVVESWIEKNNQSYRMIYDEQDRINGIQAVLGVIPLPEETIIELLQKKRLPQDITADEILSYTRGQSYSCYVVSATTHPTQRRAILQLMQHLLAYWCENDIQITRLYLSANISRDDTPALQLITHYHFLQLDNYPDEQAAWRLRCDIYNPSEQIQKYNECINYKKEKKSMAVEISKMRIEEELGNHIRGGARDLSHIAQFYVVEPDGRIKSGRGEGLVGREVWFRPINSDDDIRATLRINASLFGSSKKSLDQLVEARRLWVQKNNDIYRVLEVDGDIVGFILAIPLPMFTINRLISGEIKVSDLGLDDLQAYKTGETFNVYLQTLGVHKQFQDIRKRTYGRYLISGMLSLITDLGKRGIDLGSMYTRSDEIDGINLSLALGFDKIPPPAGVEKLVFQMDFSRSDLPFLYEYRRAIAAYQRSRSVRSGSR